MSFLAGIGKYKTPGARELAELRGRVDAYAEMHENVVNPGVEEGENAPDGWTGAGAAEWAEEGYLSGRSLWLRPQNGTAEWRSDAFRVKSGTLYRWRAQVKGVAGPQFFLTVRWFDNVGAFISENNIALNATYQGWKEVKDVIDSPAGAYTADLLFRVPNPDTGDLLGDEFSVREIH